MTNIGMRPTINAHKLTIETNIFGFNEDIYYETLTVKLIKRIRNEKKFAGLDFLQKQLQYDKEAVLEIMGEQPDSQ
jgi:riboflavin kinase/FMN adenylyltransferase